MNGSEEGFSVIAEGVGVGSPIPTGWTPLPACDCFVLAGLTGVGKSTVLALLAAQLPHARLLPDRREITDKLMIPFVQRQNGAPILPLKDRAERFDATRQYREQFPGGMAHALSELAVAPTATSEMLIFDGLRGENEIRHAAASLPNARFLMLDAPDAVRIRRLLGRQESFDRMGAKSSEEILARGGALSLASMGVPELVEILDLDQQRQLLSWIQEGQVSVDDLAAKARIIIAERRNYDPIATRKALSTYAGDRSLVVDTASATPEEIANVTVAWLRDTSLGRTLR
jgi:hypothetical protein